jgi:hypothetical protein
LLGSVSLILTGAVIVAVFAIAPLIEGETVPLIVKVALPPLSRLTVVVMLFPEPLYEPQLDPAVAVAVQETLVILAGTMSLTGAYSASFGP